MRPSAVEMLRGVRALLGGEIVEGVTSPYLRTQVMLAIGLLDAATREIEDAPAAFAEERRRMLALAAEAVPVVRAIGPADALADDLASLADVVSDPASLTLPNQTAASVRLAGLLDRLCAWCDAHAEASDEAAQLSGRVDAELHALVARRNAWGGFGTA